MRRTIKFYNENKSLEYPLTKRKIHADLDMILTDEHIILDVDHWLMFLRLIASSPEKEKFWKEHMEVAHAHWEQLKTNVHSPEEMLYRLEVCNFYRLTKNAQTILRWFWFRSFQGFHRIFLEEYFAAIGFKAEIKESLTKLRVTVKSACSKIS